MSDLDRTEDREYAARREQLFLAALKHDSSERLAFLKAECADDTRLFRDVADLLFVHQTTANVGGRVFDVVATEGDGPQRFPGSPSALVIDGKYRIKRLIGMGGMGEVYEAVRADIEGGLPVAIKVLKAELSNKRVLRRFKAEYQILANLDHPYIARLLDVGGTPDGKPYFAMEFVQGRPIDAYCDANSLSITERLELLVKVCAAVQHANRHLVIHRDLKPSNILVTADGTPKLLDFGIAKVVLSGDVDTDSRGPAVSADLTVTGQFVMTPAYASPEQVLGDPPTTATDVYSLGVVTYKLLTGRLPYRIVGNTFDAVRRAVCESDVEKPSTVIRGNFQLIDSETATNPDRIDSVREGSADRLHRRLTGDIDAIVLKALRKEPESRYPSVEEFAADIRRHLDGLPVLAHQGSFRYRLGKYLRRNVARVAFLGVVGVALIGLGFAYLGYQRAGVERQRAEAQRRLSEERAKDVREIANTLLFKLHDDVEKLPGSTAIRKEMVEQATTYLDRLSKGAGNEPALQRELALAYRRIGDVLGRPYQANVGDSRAALENYRKSLALLENLRTQSPPDASLLEELAAGYERIGDTLALTGESDAALRNYRIERDLLERISGSSQASIAVRQKMVGCRVRIGDVAFDRGDLAQARATYTEAYEIFKSIASSPTDSAAPLREATILFRLSRVSEAIADVCREAAGTQDWVRRIYGQSLEADARIRDVLRVIPEPTARTRTELLNVELHQVRVWLKSEDFPRAEKSLPSILDALRKLAALDPSNANSRRILATALILSSDVAAAVGKTGPADAARKEAVTLLEDLRQTDPANTVYIQGLGGGLESSAPGGGTLENWEKSLRLRKTSWEAHPDDRSLLVDYLRAALRYLRYLEKLGRLEQKSAVRTSLLTEMEARGPAKSEVEHALNLRLIVEGNELSPTEAAFARRCLDAIPADSTGLEALLVTALLEYRSGNRVEGRKRLERFCRFLPLPGETCPTVIGDVERRVNQPPGH